MKQIRPGNRGRERECASVCVCFKRLSAGPRASILPSPASAHDIRADVETTVGATREISVYLALQLLISWRLRHRHPRLRSRRRRLLLSLSGSQLALLMRASGGEGPRSRFDHEM